MEKLAVITRYLMDLTSCGIIFCSNSGFVDMVQETGPPRILAATRCKKVDIALRKLFFSASSNEGGIC